MRASATLLLTVCALLAAGCGGAGGPRFQSAAGWRLLAGRGELAAANVSFAAADRSMTSPPARTVATLPRSGVLIWVTVSHPGKPAGWSTPLPLRLRETAASNPFEGFGCAPAVTTAGCYSASGSVRHLRAWSGGYEADLYVFFGTDHPAPPSVAAADAELARLHLPAGKRPAPTRPVCPVPSAMLHTTLKPTSGRPGSTVTVAGALGVLNEDDSYAGQASHDADAYWNLDFHRWWSALESKPQPAVAGSRVEHLGHQDVARRCTYRLRVTVPSVRPILVLSGTAKSRSSFAPATFRVTGG